MSPYNRESRNHSTEVHVLAKIIIGDNLFGLIFKETAVAVVIKCIYIEELSFHFYIVLLNEEFKNEEFKNEEFKT